MVMKSKCKIDFINTPCDNSTSSLLQFKNHNHDEAKISLFRDIRHVRRRTPSKRIPRCLWKPSLHLKALEELDVVGADSRVQKKSSKYRGVTKHRVTGRYEAHLWDKSAYNVKQKKKGRQVYLGAYDEETDAAKAYDLAALKYWGHTTMINFKLENYSQQLKEMEKISKQEYLATLRRKSSGFSRGVSKYRGVARHHHNGRWEARIGRVQGNKYLYLGTFGTQEEAAEAYDRAAIKHRGANAVTNFELSRYLNTPAEEGPEDKVTKIRLNDSQIANTIGSGGGSPPAPQMLGNHVSRTPDGARNSPADDHFNDEMKLLTGPQDSSRFNSDDCEKMELGFPENDSFLSAEIAGLNNLFFVKQEGLISSLIDSTRQPDAYTGFGSPAYDEIFADLSLDIMMAAGE